MRGGERAAEKYVCVLKVVLAVPALRSQKRVVLCAGIAVSVCGQSSLRDPAKPSVADRNRPGAWKRFPFMGITGAVQEPADCD